VKNLEKRIEKLEQRTVGRPDGGWLEFVDEAGYTVKIATKGDKKIKIKIGGISLEADI